MTSAGNISSSKVLPRIFCKLPIYPSKMTGIKKQIMIMFWSFLRKGVPMKTVVEPTQTAEQLLDQL